jgi:hypothetical protein
VNLRAVMEEGGWQARFGSKEASGDILWREQGRGRLQARFKQLSIGSPGGAKEAVQITPGRTRIACPNCPASTSVPRVLCCAVMPWAASS